MSNQTNWIAAFLVIGFIVYVIGNNQLDQYVAVVYGDTNTAQASASSGSGLPSLPSLGSSAATAANLLQGIF